MEITLFFPFMSKFWAVVVYVVWSIMFRLSVTIFICLPIEDVSAKNKIIVNGMLLLIPEFLIVTIFAVWIARMKRRIAVWMKKMVNVDIITEKDDNLHKIRVCHCDKDLLVLLFVNRKGKPSISARLLNGH